MVLTLSLAHCAKRGSTAASSLDAGSNLFTSDGSQGVDLNASNHCFVQDPGVDGCGIGGTEKTREALGYSMLRLKDTVAKVRLGAGHSMLCRAQGQNTDTDRSKYCRGFVLGQVDQYFSLTHHDTFTFEPRKDLPGGATFMVYLKDDGGQHTIYYDQAAVAALVDKNDTLTIDRNLGHELGHFLKLPVSLAPIGYLRDNDSVAHYDGVQNAGALLLTDIGTGFSRIDQDNGGYQSLILSSKPETYLRLRENSGTVAADASGKNNAGALAGNYRQAQAGPLVQDTAGDSLAIELSGGSIRLNLAKIEQPETSAVTLEFWMWATVANTQTVAAFSVSNLRLDNGAMDFNTFMGDFLGTNTPNLTQTWTHVVSIWHPHVGQNELYLNGVRQNLSPFTTSAPLPASMPDHRLFFGSQGYVSSSQLNADFSGRLAEIAVYLRPLSAAEAYRDYVLGSDNLLANPLYGTPDITQYTESAPAVSTADNDLIPQYLIYNPASSTVASQQLTDTTTLTQTNWKNDGSVFALRATPAIGAALLYRCYDSSLGFVYQVGSCDAVNYQYRRPMGYAYQASATGRVPLYACGANQMLVTSTADCANFHLPAGALIGYALPADSWNRQAISGRP